MLQRNFRTIHDAESRFAGRDVLTGEDVRGGRGRGGRAEEGAARRTFGLSPPARRRGGSRPAGTPPPSSGVKRAVNEQRQGQGQGQGEEARRKHGTGRRGRSKQGQGREEDAEEGGRDTFRFQEVSDLRYRASLLLPHVEEAEGYLSAALHHLSVQLSRSVPRGEDEPERSRINPPPPPPHQFPPVSSALGSSSFRMYIFFFPVWTDVKSLISFLRRTSAAPTPHAPVHLFINFSMIVLIVFWLVIPVLDLRSRFERPLFFVSSIFWYTSSSLVESPPNLRPFLHRPPCPPAS
eukprot:764413-Hanusia_phi.AAC.1